MTKEQRFLEALRNVFVGAKVDGLSGYINLMRIKASYFERAVEPALMIDIKAALEDFPEFREELFDKLHAFFNRYFSKPGSICFAYTPQHISVYERVYTDEQDVVLFWKTHMLYYVKTDRLFRDLKVELDGHTFFFDCTALEQKKSNEKRELRSEEHTSEFQSPCNLVCRLLLEKKNINDSLAFVGGAPAVPGIALLTA